jgi:hypothetical protein
MRGDKKICKDFGVENYTIATWKIKETEISHYR